MRAFSTRARSAPAEYTTAAPTAKTVNIATKRRPEIIPTPLKPLPLREAGEKKRIKADLMPENAVPLGVGRSPYRCRLVRTVTAPKPNGNGTDPNGNGTANAQRRT